MINKIKKIVNNRSYQLYLNKNKIEINVTRLKNKKDYFNNLFLNEEMENEKAFFIYNEPNIFTFGLRENVDIVWVNWNNKIIHIEHSFKTNKFSKTFKNTKFIYILKEGVIKKNSMVINDLLVHKFQR